MGNKSYHSGHRERLRKRYIDYGADNFREHELLELILFYGIPRKNTNETAHKLILHFGDIKRVLNTDKELLTKVDGIGDSAASFLRLLGEVCEEYPDYLPTTCSLISKDDYFSFFRQSFCEAAEETCLLLCPDTRFSLTLSKEDLLNNDNVVKIINSLVRNECSNVVVGINRTKYPTSPEESDVTLAAMLNQRLTPLDIVLSDFLIIGEKRGYSLFCDGTFNY